MKKRKNIDQITAELARIHKHGKGHCWTGEQFVAFNLWEVLVVAEYMAEKFLENPTAEGWKEACVWLHDIELHYNSLRNMMFKTKQELDRLAKDQPLWLMYVPLKDVESCLEHLEEEDKREESRPNYLFNYLSIQGRK